ncbi:MAG: transcriptional repressor [Candidatus Latescibacteria bacterium]|nr:transcriptional repressor [Candidatus Latescibacterota bacterium]
MTKSEVYFQKYCRRAGLKRSGQRDKVFNMFLKTEQHISAFRLFEKIRKQGEKIGYSTVYRTLRLLVKAGLAQTLTFGGETHFEHKFKHKHHDYFICSKCGKTIEFTSPTIERIQNRLAKKYNFTPQKHTLLIYGLCINCQNKQ